jgi:hypothetical protein
LTEWSKKLITISDRKMPSLPPWLSDCLGSPIVAYARTGTREVDAGDDVILTSHIYDASNDGYPPDVRYVNATSPPLHERYPDPLDMMGFLQQAEESRYLWVLFPDRLEIVRERTPAPNGRGHACHTNIAGLNRALAAGELWFESPKGLYLNSKSARFGVHSGEHWRCVVRYFKSLYDPVYPVDKKFA